MIAFCYAKVRYEPLLSQERKATITNLQPSRADRRRELTMMFGERHMECAYYFAPSQLCSH